MITQPNQKHPICQVFLLLSAMFLCFCLPAYAGAKTSIKKINKTITTNQETINNLVTTYKQLNTDCTEAINNALENNLLVNKKDLKTLQKQSDQLKTKTTKLESAITQQTETEEALASITDTSSTEYREQKLQIITLQKRQITLYKQINKIMKKIIKLCTPS